VNLIHIKSEGKKIASRSEVPDVKELASLVENLASLCYAVDSEARKNEKGIKEVAKRG
jgi:hypothetical protein